MNEFKPRACPQCRTLMESRTINLHYERKGSELHIEVIGIPANVCPRCLYRLIPSAVAKHIDALIDPLYERVAKQKKQKVLPVPHTDIQFAPRQRQALQP